MSYFHYNGTRIFYNVFGQGTPVLFLHGNTASSNMFEPFLPLYQERFQVILMDFLGNGRSDRVDAFPADLWFSQAMQAIGLLEHLNLGRASLVGTSGGAWAAVNAALERPDLIDKVVADSFDGRTLAEDFAQNLSAERAFAKSDPLSRQFYEWCQGADWERVVDLDTEALLACARSRSSLFRKPLESLSVPILLMGSREDAMCRKDLKEEYQAMNRLIPDSRIHLFPTGGHPAIGSNAEEAARVIAEFLTETKPLGQT